MLAPTVVSPIELPEVMEAAAVEDGEIVTDPTTNFSWGSRAS